MGVEKLIASITRTQLSTPRQSNNKQPQANMELFNIAKKVAYILETMNEDSQYWDYEKEFEYIETSVQAYPHLVIAYNKLAKEMYLSKGSLDLSLIHI